MNQKNMLFILGMAVPIIIMIVVLTYFNNLSGKTEDEPFKTVSLFEMPQYKDKKLDNVLKIEVNKYTVGGLDTTVVEDKQEISNIMYNLLHIRLENETHQVCEDNTTIYVITTEEDTIRVEIECDWVIIGDKRYLIQK